MRIKTYRVVLLVFAAYFFLMGLYQNRKCPPAPAGIWGMRGRYEPYGEWTAKIMLWEAEDGALVGFICWEAPNGDARNDKVRMACDPWAKTLILIGSERAMPPGLDSLRCEASLDAHAMPKNSKIWKNVPSEEGSLWMVELG